MTTYPNPNPRLDEDRVRAQSLLIDADAKSNLARTCRTLADGAARACRGQDAARMLASAEYLEKEAAKLREQARALVRGDQEA